jgi:hypothetical protein
VGWLPGAVRGNGLSDGSGEDATAYTWQAPAVPVTVSLRPGTVSKVQGTPTSFGPEKVTTIDLAAASEPLSFISLERPFYVETHVRVRGQAPCRSTLPVELHSSTLSICSGAAGESAWMGDAYGGLATVHAEGNCGLGVSMPGGAVLGNKSFAIFNVQAPPADLELPGDGNPCPVEGGTSCAYGYGDVGICQAGRWVEKTYCGSAQTCDFVSSSTKGCVSGASCAICRNQR